MPRDLSGNGSDITVGDPKTATEDNVNIGLMGGAAITPVTAGADGVSNTATGSLTYARNLVYNGATWDRWYGGVTGANVRAVSRAPGADALGNYICTFMLATDNNASGGPLSTVNYNYNGTSWDRQKKPNIFKRVASSAASGNPDFIKASAGDVHKVIGECGATKAYLQLYNKVSAPVIASDSGLILLTIPLAANAMFDIDVSNFGAYFPAGIAFALTTDYAGTTGSAAAAASLCILAS